MRPRTISLVVTLGVFLGGLALVWALGGESGRTARASSDRIFTFPLNSTSRLVSVRSPWRLGHMTPQDDQVELTLVGKCATAHLYAYLSTGWDHGPLNAATVILGVPLHPQFGPPPTLVRHDATSALVLSRESERGVLVQEDAPRNYDTLLVVWQSVDGCSRRAHSADARALGRLFETFQVIAQPGVTPRTGAL